MGSVDVMGMADVTAGRGQMLPIEEPQPHAVQFYEEDEALLERLAGFAGSALSAGNACLILATAAHRSGLAERLTRFGVNVERVVNEGRLVLLDAAETLELITTDGSPDSSRFTQLIEPLLAKLVEGPGKKRRRVSAFGELVALLWADGKPEAAVRLEQMWNDLRKRQRFELLCGYPIGGFDRAEHERFFRAICAEHSDVAPCESYGRLNSETERMVAVAALQQKAEMLEIALEERERTARALSDELQRRNEIEDALRKSEEFARNIVESSADCIKVLECDGRIVYLSPQGRCAMGVEDVALVLGRSWISFWGAEDQPRAAEAVAMANAGGVGRFEGALVVGGVVQWWDVTISPMLSRAGEVERLVAISRETTELKLAQTALMQAEKLAAAGRLAATVAHEINNPLEAVTNSIYLAKTTCGLPEEVFQLLDTADRELARVGHIAQQTLGFYRDNANPERFDVGRAIREVAAIYESKLQTKDLRLELRIAESEIFARRGELKQVLSNLLTNAIDANGCGGRIAIRAHSSKNWASGADGMRILVADKGDGMSEQTKEKAFSAFFTTKTQVGTGIGLWVTRKIVENHGGSIRCRSRQGTHGGTVMNVFFPNE